MTVVDTVSSFERAADAVVTGDADALGGLLRAEPELARARSTRVHRATLLHYSGANGVEESRQRSPQNANQIAQMLLDAGAEVDGLADIYGKSTALGLVATSIYPALAGVQIALLKTLLDYGAALDGVPGVRSPLIAALHNGRREAAEFLAQRGARLDLEGAAGVGRLDLVESFFNGDGTMEATATQQQREDGFLWACEYGRNRVVEFLLEKGANLEAQGTTGLTGLHWAVVGGQLKTIELLLQRGASLDVLNQYGGNALGQVLWSALSGDRNIDYVPVLELLLQAGARVEEGSLNWLAQQSGRSQLESERISEVLKRYGART